MHFDFRNVDDNVFIIAVYEIEDEYLRWNNNSQFINHEYIELLNYYEIYEIKIELTLKIILKKKSQKIILIRKISQWIPNCNKQPFHSRNLFFFYSI